MRTELAVSYAEVKAAHARVRDRVHRTPVLTSTLVNDVVGARAFFKAESLQRIGAFKFRGAYNAIAKLTPDELRVGVAAFSSGNHAQAVALAARELDTTAVVLMPEDAPRAKHAAAKAYGAEVITYNHYTDDREELAAELVAERGLTLIPPFDHPDIIAGQGTAGLELMEDAEELDVLLVPLGGGGLLSGCALAARELRPDIAIYGVEPAAGDDGRQSFRSGSIVTIDPPNTIADGARTRALGARTFPIIQELVDDILTVTDEQIVNTMRFLAERMKIIVEPTGALAATALLEHKRLWPGKRVGVILSGGNVDFNTFAHLMREGTV